MFLCDRKEPSHAKCPPHTNAHGSSSKLVFPGGAGEHWDSDRRLALLHKALWHRPAYRLRRAIAHDVRRTTPDVAEPAESLDPHLAGILPWTKGERVGAKSEGLGDVALGAIDVARRPDDWRWTEGALMAYDGVLSDEASAATAPPALETPACAFSSFTKSRLALSPRPSNVAPDCPPRSDISSYASLMALNFSMLASGFRSGCSVAMSRR